MFCQNCGKKNSDGEKVCYSCGFSLKTCDDNELSLEDKGENSLNDDFDPKTFKFNYNEAKARRSIYEARAQKGDAKSIYIIASLYKRDKKYFEAMKYYEKICDKYPSILFLMGIMCQVHFKREDLAFKLFKKGADFGDDDAIVSLAKCYFYGKGIEKNKDKAVKLYEKAAVLGNGEAMLSLGKLYEEGNCVDENEYMAFEYYKRACDTKTIFDKESYYRVGLCYWKGLGVEKNKKLAIKYIRESADAEYFEAQEWLTENGDRFDDNNDDMDLDLGDDDDMDLDLGDDDDVDLDLDDDDDVDLDLGDDDDVDLDLGDDDDVDLDLDDDDDVDLDLDDDDDVDLDLDDDIKRDDLKNKLIKAKEELKEYWSSYPELQQVIETNFIIFADLLFDHKFRNIYEKLAPSYEVERAYLNKAKSNKDIKLLRDACFNFSLNHTCCLTIEQVLKDKDVSSFVNNKLDELVEKYNAFEDVYETSEEKKERRNAAVKKGFKIAGKIIGGIAISPLLIAGALLGDSDDSGSSEKQYRQRNDENGQESVWQCDYCGKIAYSVGKPLDRNVGECSLKISGRAKHAWVELGKAGDTKHVCKNCGVKVYTNRTSHPSRGNCDPGYAHHRSHVWDW